MRDRWKTEFGISGYYTVKDNQPHLREYIEKQVDDPASPFLS